MKPRRQEYLLKEYGSWSVLAASFLLGLGAGGGFAWRAIPLFFALGLLVNSKQALTKWTRRPGDRASLAIFLGHLFIAAILLLSIFGSGILMLLPLLVFPAAYLVAGKIAGEHFILTEVLGFALLSLAAVLAKFLLTGGLDVRLFLGVALYFSAGVFKIKILLLKKTRDRILAVLYLIFTAFVYRRLHIPLIVLLPLIDNLIVAAAPYRVKLRTTGWIEVAKSLAFLGLFLRYY
ncbi:MAG TPA: YwiC-like family protein [Nitrospirota bacterium]